MEESLLSIAKTVGLPEVDHGEMDDSTTKCQKLLDDLKQTIQTQLLASKQKPPRPVFQHQLNEAEWKMVDEYAEMLNLEFAQRAQLMVKRLEVTFESFFWSDRVKKLEEKIMEVYQPAKEAMVSPQGVFAEDVLSATTDILCVEKATSKSRQSTSNPIISYLVKQQPRDRGGRTAEMKVPQAEVSSWQQRSREACQSQASGSQGRGGGGRGGGWHGGRVAEANMVAEVEEVNRVAEVVVKVEVAVGR
uniref:Protein FAM98A n=1 Tax=Ditylenchus dipsaci TaxID=166011 RepID=A0A915DX54_9BILA